MIPLFLQSALKEKIELVLDSRLLSSQEEKVKKIPVFEQHLPRKVKSTSRNPENTNYPCVIVYLDEWENGQAKILFIIATYDNSDDNQGYKDAVNIAERVNQELIRNPMLDKRFEMQETPKWHYSDQENFPFFFAWGETYWTIPRVERDDVEAMI